MSLQRLPTPKVSGKLNDICFADHAGRDLALDRRTGRRRGVPLLRHPAPETLVRPSGDTVALSVPRASPKRRTATSSERPCFATWPLPRPPARREPPADGRYRSRCRTVRSRPQPEGAPWPCRAGVQRVLLCCHDRRPAVPAAPAVVWDGGEHDKKEGELWQEREPRACGGRRRRPLPAALPGRRRNRSSVTVRGAPPDASRMRGHRRSTARPVGRRTSRGPRAWTRRTFRPPGSRGVPWPPC